jgi:phosphotransferase system HPr-like phosphotransfer protein
LISIFWLFGKIPAKALRFKLYASIIGGARNTGRRKQMKIFHVQLTSISDVKQFVNAACDQPFDIDIAAGRYVIDAKSIMGIFSLDLGKPIRVEVHGTEEDAAGFYEKVKAFAAEQ